MRRDSRLGSVFVFSLILLLLWNVENVRAEASQIETDRAKLVVVSINGLTDRSMILVRSVRLTTGIKGRIAVYDDVTTKKPADIAVLYNASDAIVAIVWFDRFGIERLAVDSGFLHRAPELTGLYVVITAGEHL
jgi:hypothetical protein